MKNHIEFNNRPCCLLLIICYMIITSCVKTDDDNLKVIYPINLNRPLSVDITELIDSITYVPLQTLPSCTLGYIQGLTYTNHCFVIKADNRLYTFSSDGRFISEISNRGNGPNEYVNIDTYFIDNTNKIIGILCGIDNKILYYNYEGTYEYTIHIADNDAYGIDKIEVLPDGSLLAHYNLSSLYFPTDAQYKLLTIQSGQISSTKMVDASKLNTKDMGIHPYMYYPMALYNEYLAIMPMSNIISSYNYGQMTHKYKVETRHELVTNRFVKDYWTGSTPDFINQAYRSNKSPGILRIFSSDNYLFLSDNYSETIVWDGTDAIMLGNVSHSNLNIEDGALVSGLADNCWGTYDAYFLLDSREKIHDSRLYGIIQNLEYDSNPVVFRYHFKKNLIDILKKKIQGNNEI